MAGGVGEGTWLHGRMDVHVVPFSTTSAVILNVSKVSRAVGRQGTTTRLTMPLSIWSNRSELKDQRAEERQERGIADGEDSKEEDMESRDHRKEQQSDISPGLLASFWETRMVQRDNSTKQDRGARVGRYSRLLIPSRRDRRTASRKSKEGTVSLQGEAVRARKTTTVTPILVALKVQDLKLRQELEEVGGNFCQPVLAHIELRQ